MEKSNHDAILKRTRKTKNMGYVPHPLPRCRPSPPPTRPAASVQNQINQINDKLDKLIELLQPSETEEKLRK